MSVFNSTLFDSYKNCFLVNEQLFSHFYFLYFKFVALFLFIFSFQTQAVFLKWLFLLPTILSFFHLVPLAIHFLKMFYW